MPTGVLVLYLLLMLVFVGGSRSLVRIFYERPLRGFRAHRDARSVLIVGAGEGGRLVLSEVVRNPDLGCAPSGSSTTTRASRARGSTAGSRCSGHRAAAGACSRTSSPTRC